MRTLARLLLISPESCADKNVCLLPLVEINGSNQSRERIGKRVKMPMSSQGVLCSEKRKTHQQANALPPYPQKFSCHPALESLICIAACVCSESNDCCTVRCRNPCVGKNSKERPRPAFPFPSRSTERYSLVGNRAESSIRNWICVNG